MSRRSLRHGRTKKSQGQIKSGRDDFIIIIKILEWLEASEKAKRGFRSKNELRTVLEKNPENPKEKDWEGTSIDQRRFGRIINDLEYHGYVKIKKSLFGGVSSNDIKITEDGKKLFENRGMPINNKIIIVK